MIPNLYRGFAAAPATLKIYLAMNEVLKEYGHLSPVEQQVVYLTVSAESGCAYCMGAHSVLAGMAGIPERTCTELRDQRALSDPRLDALRNFTLSVMAHRGWVPDQDLAALQAAGYDQRHVLEILTILAQKTLSNYFNHIAHTPPGPDVCNAGLVAGNKHRVDTHYPRRVYAGCSLAIERTGYSGA